MMNNVHGGYSARHEVATMEKKLEAQAGRLLNVPRRNPRAPRSDQGLDSVRGWVSPGATSFRIVSNEETVQGMVRDQLRTLFGELTGQRIGLVQEGPYVGCYAVVLPSAHIDVEWPANRRRPQAIESLTVGIHNGYTFEFPRFLLTSVLVNPPDPGPSPEPPQVQTPPARKAEVVLPPATGLRTIVRKKAK